MALTNSNLLGIVSVSPRTRAVRALKQWVNDGRLPAGERLPTEARLAAKLNVSRSTIRLALKDLEKEGLVSDDPRRRIVLDLIKPNKTFLSDSVVLITDLPDKFERRKMAGTWHSNFIHTGATDAIREAGYDAVNIHPNRVAGDLIQRLILQQPRGVIVLRSILQTPSGQHLPQALKEGNIPFVVYGYGGTDLGKPAVPYDTVTSDHEFGAHELTKWLISQGRRRVLRIWNVSGSKPTERPEWILERDRGYERAMKEAGLETIPPLEIYNSGPGLDAAENFHALMRQMAGHLIDYLKMKEPVDAVMAASDSFVPMVASALKVHDRVPNKDVWIVGYDNIGQDLLRVGRSLSIEVTPPVATVDKNHLEIGYELMNLLQKRIEGKLPNEPQHRVIKPELIVLQEPGAR